MKTIIAVHTGTGNTLHIASMIKDAEIHFIDEFLSGKYVLPEDTGRLGIMYPVYSFGIPYIVERFIREIIGERDNSSLEYLFAINTNGGFPGSANYALEQLLRENGVNLAYAASIKMPDAYLPVKKRFPSEMNTLALTYKRTKQINRIIKDVENSELKLPRKGFLSKTISKMATASNLPRSGNSLTISDECVGCGICSRICPMDNISMENGKPVFADRCIGCYACYHRCPEHALKYKGAVGQYKGLQDTAKLFRR